MAEQEEEEKLQKSQAAKESSDSKPEMDDKYLQTHSQNDFENSP